MNQKKIPNSNLIYFSALFSCFLFIFGGFAIVLSVLSLYLSNKSKRLHNLNPSIYYNIGKIKKARVIAIIGLVLNVLVLGVTIWTLSTIGWDAWSDEFIRRWNEGLQNRG